MPKKSNAQKSECPLSLSVTNTKNDKAENPHVPLIKRPYRFVPTRFAKKEGRLVISKYVKFTSSNYVRVNQYAKAQRISYSQALDKLLGLPDVLEVLPPIPPPPPKSPIVSKYSSFPSFANPSKSIKQ